MPFIEEKIQFWKKKTPPHKKLWVQAWVGLDEGYMPIHKLWDLDAIGIDATAPSPQDDVAYQQYLNSLKFTDKYYARLPWKRDHDPLPHNYKMAVGQLHALISSLRHKPDLLDHYDKIIKEQLDDGFVERVPNPKITNSTHYIPHHAVMKDSPTTPVRIMYNCSAKPSKGTPSLNDCLMKGPSMTENLANILLIFRTNMPFLQTFPRHSSELVCRRSIETSPDFCGLTIPKIQTQS